MLITLKAERVKFTKSTPGGREKLDFGVCNSAQGIRNLVPRIRSPQREIQIPRLSWIVLHNYTVVNG